MLALYTAKWGILGLQLMHRDTVLYYFCYFDLENIGVRRLMLYFYVYVGVCVFITCKVL